MHCSTQTPGRQALMVCHNLTPRLTEVSVHLCVVDMASVRQSCTSGTQGLQGESYSVTTASWASVKVRLHARNSVRRRQCLSVALLSTSPIRRDASWAQ
ncbi:hypothetical protein NP493_705g02073 [Ridgeia piscesae]|uniref:Uncharacterized protein n=1 Tax=Ridgeia piscesae TaxID=27915 RepID=A0AAD9NPF7_RIDPI|nr:hypothetical protein NP493_705g02073 [Ridgeia piscesae]